MLLVNVRRRVANPPLNTIRIPLFHLRRLAQPYKLPQLVVNPQFVENAVASELTQRGGGMKGGVSLTGVTSEEDLCLFPEKFSNLALIFRIFVSSKLQSYLRKYHVYID